MVSTPPYCIPLNALQVQFECNLESFEDNRLVDPPRRCRARSSRRDQPRGECEAEIIGSKRTHISRVDRAIRSDKTSSQDALT